MGTIWARYSQPTPTVPLKPPLDPLHSTDPTPDPNVVPGMRAPWESTVNAPVLPDSVTGEDPGVPIGGGGPLDHTPDDPQYGPGFGPGITQVEASALRGKWQNRDDGAVAAHAWVASIDRDGVRYADFMAQTQPPDGESPDTNLLKRTGVGVPTDPYARTGRPRLKRWMDRVIDFHWWNPEYRPMYARVPAGRAVQTPPVPNGNQYTSPFGGNMPFEGSPNRFLAPQERRTPQPWDNQLVQDPVGTADASQVGSWGL